MARLADGPGGAIGQTLPGSARFAQDLSPRHRVGLAADAAITEAVVLVSIVTEGGGKTNGSEARGWHPSTPEPAGGDAYRGGWGSREEQGALRPDQMEDNLQGSGKEHQEMRRQCLETVEAAAGLGFDELRRRHIDDVEALFDRVHFSLEPSSDGSSGTEGRRAGMSSSGSCVAGLPIRTRVARSGRPCSEGGEEGLDPLEGAMGSGGLDGRKVVDDSLIELMYHYGR